MKTDKQFKITKDEASIFVFLLNEGKYDLNDYPDYNYDRLKGIKAFQKFEDRIRKFSKDKRRTRFDDKTAVIKRIVNKYSDEKTT
jgi:hypothetical protein